MEDYMKDNQIEEETNEADVYTCVKWAPRGCFSLNPQKLDEDTIQKSMQMFENNDDDDDAMEDKKENKKDDSDDDDMMEDTSNADPISKKFNMDNYDSDDAKMENDKESLQNLITKKLMEEPASTFYKDEEEDPYLKVSEKIVKKDDKKSRNKHKDDEDEDKEEYELNETDMLFYTVYNEEFISTLQVFAFQPDMSHMYMHHDVPLRDHGLCLEWVGYCADNADGKNNLCAVGTYNPVIEIWDMDIIDPVEPLMSLGETYQENKKSGKFKKKNSKDAHKGAVLDISWNKTHVEFLASASDDKSVKIWDLEKGVCATTLKHHKSPVQCVQWNQLSPEFVLTAGFDHNVFVVDPRILSSAKKIHLGTKEGDFEKVKWSPFLKEQFTVSFENGKIMTFDTRKLEKKGKNSVPEPLYSFSPHNTACTDFVFAEPHTLVTCSDDKTVKTWMFNKDSPNSIPTEGTPMNIGNPLFGLDVLDSWIVSVGPQGSPQIDLLEK